ncbi:Probable protein phosphatase 2C 67 [Linum perenne]
MGKPKCWRACMEGDDTVGKMDGLMWHKDLGSHSYGDFSMAVIQANGVLEDYSQLESGPNGTFVGVYDGHAGHQASQFISNNLFFNLKNLASEHGGEVTESILKKAFSATEEGFLSVVKKQWMSTPEIASAGSCCLAGVFCNGMLYVANAGDSRAVLGRVERGDVYLKKAEFQREPLLPKFRLSKTFEKPILNSEPEVTIHMLDQQDQFVIFASDGLWEHLSNQEAVDIVHNFPRNGVAKRLVRAALHEAAKKREMRYADLQKIHPGVRRHFHDDITVIVVFIDCGSASRAPLTSYVPCSIKGGVFRH